MYSAQKNEDAARSLLCVWLILQLVSGMRVKQSTCPQICVCRSSDLHTDCRYNSLTELPEGIFSQVMVLDFSYNLFTHVPKGLSAFKQLEYLNMSHNQIKRIDSNGLDNIRNLKLLDLSYNMFSEWMDIHKDALSAVPALQELDLSFNSLRGFPDIIEHPLNSDSLETLSLVNCSITNLLGDILVGLTNLKNLMLSNNPLVGLNTQIKSQKLLTLDLSHCKLQRIRSNVFIELKALEVLKLGKNYELKTFHCNSLTLKILDISHCNLDSILSGNLPNLTKLTLQGNHIRHIPADVFLGMPLLHSLDLSSNTIDKIDSKAFQGLKLLQSINLSFNRISSLDYDTFTINKNLYNVNLSRNYFSELGQLEIEFIKSLDLSVCEIRNIDKDSLTRMPKLQHLNLSRNLLTQLPSELQAHELRMLDLSNCGIYQLNNQTFSKMSRLNYLSLSGNKLVSVKPSFFHDIKVLHLDDNAWFCNCASEEFKELHHWLYNLMSISGLHCRYPEIVAGITWEKACAKEWDTPEVGNSDGMWIYSVSLVVLMTTICCVVVSIRQAYYRKAVRAIQQEDAEQDEVQEQLRCIHQQTIQESTESINRNAPDPRELQTPPSYSEAISMPRLNISCNSLVGSHRSLHSLHSLQSETSGRRAKVRRKRRRKLENKSPGVSEPQSAAASLSRLQTDDSSSDQSNLQRRGRTSNNNNINNINSNNDNNKIAIIESSF